MIIILEGPDGTGKTTLAQKLSKEHNLPIFHEGPPTSPNLYRQYQHRLLTCPSNCILDRAFHGEMVYGPLVRGKSRISEFQLQALEMLALRRGAVVVWCHANQNDMHLRIRERGEISKIDQLVLDAPHLFVNLYEQVRVKSILPGYFYDSSRNDPFRLEFKTTLALPGTGSRDPLFILVGDENGEVPFDSGAAAKFLFQSLGYKLQHTLLINSTDRKLGPIRSYGALLSAFSNNPTAKIFALGRRAAARVVLTGFKYTHVPHPQYWQRFRQVEWYGSFFNA